MKHYSIFLLVLLLSACGGSSSGNKDPGVIAELNASAYTTCARTFEGEFKCWGEGSSYNFANGLNEIIADEASDITNGIPSAQLGDTPIVHAETNEYFGCALFNDKNVKCWGDNEYVGLSDPSSDPSDHTGDTADELGNNLPIIDFGTDLYATQLTLGNSHACVVLNNGRVKCWGEGRDGRTGYGDEEIRGDNAGEMGDNLPFVDLGLDTNSEHYTVKQIDAGWDLTCAILSNDQLKCWGENDKAQLGYGDLENRGDDANEMGDNLPFVDLGSERSVKEVFVYYEHTCAILDNDSLKCWGVNNDGEIGLGTGDDIVGNNVPRFETFCNDGTAEVLYTQTSLSAGNAFCALGGTEFSYTNDYNNNDLFDDVTTTTGYYCNSHDLNKIVAVANLNPGEGGCPDGGVQLLHDFDNDGDGLINQGNEDNMGDNLQALDFGSTSPVIDVLLGDDHTCGLLADGTLKCWGDNGYGQSGIDNTVDWGEGADETPANRESPDLGAGLYATAIAGSYNFSCAVLNDDTIKCWGYDDDYGTLGVPEYYDTAIGDGDPADEMGEALQSIQLFAPSI